MHLRGILLLNILFFILVSGVTSLSAEVIIEPFGTAVFLDEELEEEFIITLSNEGDTEVNFEISVDPQDIINPGEGRDNLNRSIRRIDQTVAPRRDLDSRGILIAENCGWFNWDFERYFQSVAEEEDFDYDRFRTWNDVEDIDFTDYDIMWLGNYESDGWVAQYNQNLERIEEFVDNGGALHHCNGTNNHGTRPINPGGLQYVNSQSQNNCPLQLNPEDNWLINYMNENDPFNWEWREGQQLVGGGCAHGYFTQDGIDEIENSDFHQVIALGNPVAEPIIVVYQYGRGFVLTSTTVDGYLHNSPDRFHWGRTGEAIIYYLDVLANVAPWIEFEPEEGVLEPDGDADLTISILGEEMGVGTHYVILEIELDDPNQPLIQLPIMMTIDGPIFDLFGEVVDESNGEPLSRVNVTTYPYDFRRRTNNNGEVEIMHLPSDEYDVHFSLTDYLPQMTSFEVGDNDIIDLEISMLHSQCNLDLEEIVDELPVDGQSETVVTVSNDGNGPLAYTTDRRLLGDANAEPWELRIDVEAGVVAEDSRIQGAVFDGDNFYLSGANNREPVMYVLNRDQELIDQYPQLGEGRYGYKDLAFDGELIWGSGERVVYGFNTAGEEVITFDSGISPCNNLAYDSDRDILWCSGTTTDLFGFDREGNQVGEAGRHNLRVYGLAYWPDDPDGYQLYVYHKINEVGDLMIAKIDIENDQMMEVVNLEHELGGVAQGCFITNQYDIYSWVLMGVANNGAEDRIDIWQVDARKDWMGIDPTEGVIEAGEQQEFVVTLDATGLPQAPFEGEIVFFHDGIGGETHLPITLQVGEGGGEEEMVLELTNGWNMVSAYVQPDPDDVREITARLVEAGTLILMKNAIGQFYNPQFNFNNIPGWRVEEGYMIKMDGADELTLSGMAVQWDEPIALDVGWQMISYYPREGVDAVLALSGIVDVLIMAKDSRGRFYNPQFNFSNMGDMIPGQGYLVKMDEAAELVYTVEEEVANQISVCELPNLLPIHRVTSENMSLLVLSDITDGEIGVYTNGNLVGSGVIQNGKCGIAVWGDDPTTSQVDGAQNGESLEILHHNSANLTTIQYKILIGDDKYTTDGLQVVRLKEKSTLPERYGIVSAYPNPFNSTTSITINLPEASQVKFDLFDLNGRIVSEIASGKMKTGIHTFTLDGSFLSSGVYIAQLQASGKNYKQKLTLLK